MRSARKHDGTVGTRRILRSFFRAAPIAVLLTVLSGCDWVIVGQRYVTDPRGGALVLHGANTHTDGKWAADHVGATTQAEVDHMASEWGWNLARVLVHWEALEPAPGVYDEEYLDLVEERVAWYRDAGMWVVLDMHQDLYSDCCGIGGNGFPEWATRTDGLPVTPRTPWFLTYFEPGVMRAFDNFFSGAGANADLREHYAAAWQHVAERFRDTRNVIGYDLMNEPFMGTQPSDVFEAGRLTEFSQEMVDAIRAVDVDGWIFVEPVAAQANFGLPSHLGHITDPRPGDPHLAYMPHLYPLDISVGTPYTGDQTALRDWAQERTEDAERLGMPVLIGEFGLATNHPGADAFLRDALAMADATTSGWAYWAYEDGGWGPFDRDGNETVVAEALVRAYPRRVAGNPIAYGFDPEARTFALVWDEKPGVRGATRIFVPADRMYPNGFDVAVSDPGGLRSRWDPERQILTVRADRHESRHVLLITPRA